MRALEVFGFKLYLTASGPTQSDHQVDHDAPDSTSESMGSSGILTQHFQAHLGSVTGCSCQWPGVARGRNDVPGPRPVATASKLEGLVFHLECFKFHTS
jgi:hypothetical protein